MTDQEIGDYNNKLMERDNKLQDIVYQLKEAADSVYILLDQNPTMTYPEACYHPDTEKHIKEATRIAKTL
jgi:hypothetical protein